MRFRSFDSNQDLMPEGEYEVYVKSCEETETRGGTPCIAFDSKIFTRTGIPGHGRKRKLAAGPMPLAFQRIKTLIWTIWWGALPLW